jgi:uncharacterized cupredoxin-like copper-binding protein
MNRRVLVLGAALVLVSACGSASAVTLTPPAATTAGTAAATMSPAEMAAMGHPTATAASQPAATAPVAGATANPQTATSTPAPAINAGTSGPTAAPAPTTTAAPTAAPAATSAPTPAPTAAPTAAPAGQATTVSVTLVDMAIKLSTTSVAAGTVTFNVTNGGTTIHEFVVLQTAIAQNALPADPANPGTVLEPGFLGKVGNLAPHATGSLTLTLGAGSYVLICNEPAHYTALGMHTAFSVR